MYTSQLPIQMLCFNFGLNSMFFCGPAQIFFGSVHVFKTSSIFIIHFNLYNYCKTIVKGLLDVQ